MYEKLLYTINNTAPKPAAGGYIRAFHAVPDAPNVDIYANDQLIAKSLAYGDYTSYSPVPAGDYKVSLYPAGKKEDPIITNMLTVKDNSILTVAAVGTLSDIGFLAVTDANKPMIQNMAMARFLHLSPNAPNVDITLPDGTVIFSNVAYKQITPYIAAPPMNYTLQIRVAGTPNVVMTIPNIGLKANTFYSGYAIGLAGGEPALEAVLLEDGNAKSK